MLRAAALVCGFALAVLRAADPCRIEIVEKGSGWPVPMVELRTVDQVRFVSDNAGVIACDAPEMMGRETWFGVTGHGYEVAKDGFGFRGVRLTPEPGKTLRVEVDRQLPAKRLGRLTGAGLFAESQKTGREMEWRDQGLVGCDSVQNAVYGGKLFWLWGDTLFAKYPLGVFDMSGATTAVRPLEKFEPPLRLRFDYFRDEKGVPRGVAKMPGSGPTWVSGFTTLPDKQGREHLVGCYIKVRNYLEAYEAGLCVWNDGTQQFDLLRKLWTKTDAAQKKPLMPEGHPAFWKDAEGKEWVYFGLSLPELRCPATFEAWQDEKQWESLKPHPPLARAGGGKPVKLHTGSIAWNAFRKRWVTVFMEERGEPSAFGELWYSEADAPEGPWGTAVKVVTHENYTFYNPRLHPEFAAADSPVLIFEGTFTQEFANHAQPSPRYNYNQILYRLDLDDPALAPARAHQLR